MTLTLVEFLHARLDEDEQIARGCVPGPWSLYGPPAETTVSGRGISVALGWLRDLRHVARHDPARVLAEIVAKRRILDLHHLAEVTIDGKAVCAKCVHPDAWTVTHLPDDEVYPCQTVRLLALPYADHADCQQEWRP